jgi:hypothetical protein
MAELALLAATAAPVARVVMRWAPTEVAARVVWAVTPVMAGRAALVVRVPMPVAAQRRRRVAPVVRERAVVLAARVA